MRIDLVKYAPLLSAAFKVWGSTLRYRQFNEQPAKHLVDTGQKFISAAWHGEIFSIGYKHRIEKPTAIVSKSKDGDIVYKMITSFGYNAVRGSSSRGGLNVLRELLSDPQILNTTIAITLDGPRGPRHKAKQGAVYLASKLGLPMVSVRSKSYQAYTFKKAWDQFQLPLPFSRCDIYYGDPVLIPQDLDKKGIEKEIIKLENTMHTLPEFAKKREMS